MKHFFTLIFLIAQAQFAISQINITSNDLAEIGSTYPRIIDTLPEVTQGEAGENLIWDFSTISVIERDTVSFIEATGTPYADDFPNAEFCIRLGMDIDYAYATSTNTELSILGGSQYVDQLEDVVIAHFDPTQTNMMFPATYGTTFNDSYGSEITRYYGQTVSLPGFPFPVFVDSVRIVNETTSTVNFDAWGELVTPYGDFSTIRSHRVDYLENQLFAYSSTAGFWVNVTDWLGENQSDTVSVYSWWAKDVGYPVVEMKTNFETAEVEKVKCLEYEDLSIAEENTTHFATAYPVPANKTITINANYNGTAQLKIFDMTGSIVISETINKFPYLVDISELSGSLYFYKIFAKNKTQVGHGKFSVVH